MSSAFQPVNNSLVQVQIQIGYFSLLRIGFLSHFLQVSERDCSSHATGWTPLFWCLAFSLPITIRGGEDCFKKTVPSSGVCSTSVLQ